MAPESPGGRFDGDGDGDTDVLAGSVLDDEIAWYENYLLPDCNGNGIPDQQEISSGSGTDCDGDGTLDECQIAADATLDLDQNGVFDACESIGSSYCGPAVANSTGEGASIMALGTTSVPANNVTLTARQLPRSSFGMFVVSRTQGFSAQVPNSQGALCVAGAVGRFNRPGQIVASGATGTFLFPIDLTAIPTPNGLTQVLFGDTWNFQAWFRDNNPGVTSNFTDAVSLTFL